jgi:excisionase family DNA binding protein
MVGSNSQSDCGYLELIEGVETESAGTHHLAAKSAIRYCKDSRFSPCNAPRSEFTKKVMLEKLLTLEEVADYLNVDKFTVYRLLAEKELPAFKVGNQWRFKRKQIENWLGKHSNVRKKSVSKGDYRRKDQAN